MRPAPFLPAIAAALLLVCLPRPLLAQRVTATLAAGNQPSAVVVNPATDKIYVANQNSNSVTVISGATNGTSTVALGGSPFAAAVDPSTNKVFVALQGLAGLAVIDGATDTATYLPVGGTGAVAVALNPVVQKAYVADISGGFVSVVDIGSGSMTTAAAPSPWAVAVNTVTNRVFVANTNHASVTVLDGFSGGLVTTVTVGASPAALAVDEAANKVYVANYGSASVTVIDGATYGTTTVGVGTNPIAVAVNPVTHKIYLPNWGSNTVTVVDGNTLATATLPAGTNPRAVALDAATNRVYVANYFGSPNLTVIDGATDTAATTLTVGAGVRSMGVNPLTNRLYTGDYLGNTVTVLDGSTLSTTTVSITPAGSGPQGIAVNPVTNKIYTANNGASTVTEIDGATGATANIPVGSGPYTVAVNPITDKIYVSDSWANLVTVIDGPTRTTAHVAVGSVPQALAVNPVTNKIYVANWSGASVTVIDGLTLATQTVAVGTTPYDVAVNPATNKIYVANASTNNVTVIDGATLATATVSAGTFPLALAVNPVTNKIYVANQNSDSVTVIDGATNGTTTVSTPAYPIAIALNPVTNKVYVANNTAGGEVTVIDGATLGTTLLDVGTSPHALAADPVTNKVYVANYTGNDISVIDGVTHTAAAVPGATGPRSVGVAVNPITHKAYVSNYMRSSVTVLTERPAAALPLTCTIDPFPANQTSRSTPPLSGTAASTYSPIAPPVQGVFFQLDTLQGAWNKASWSGGSLSWSGTSPALSNGLHLLYAYAVDHQDATTVNAASSPLPGAVQAYLFLKRPCAPLAAAIDPILPSASVCRGTEQTFSATASGEGALTYEWDFAYNGVNFVPMATGVTAAYTYPAAGAYTVALRVTDSCLSPKAQQVRVQTTNTVYTLPAPTIAESCSGADLILDAGAGFAAYLWSPGGATTQTLNIGDDTSTLYAVTVTDANGCQGGDTHQAAAPCTVPTCVKTPEVTTYGTTGNERGYGLAVAGGALFVTGIRRDGVNADALTLRYALPPTGAPVWTNVWTGDYPTSPCVTPDQQDYGYAVAVSDEGAYVAGMTTTCASDGSGGKEAKSLLLKLGLAAGAQVWWNSPNYFSYRGGESYSAVAVAVEGGTPYAYAAGFGQANGSNMTFTLAKYASGASAPVWTRTNFSTASSRYSQGTGILCDGGYIWVSGYNDDAGASARRASLLRFDAAGNAPTVWNWAPAGRQAVATALATDGSGNYYLAGYTYLPAGTAIDLFVAKYDASGTQLWKREWGGAGDDRGMGAAWLGGRLYVTGQTNSSGAGGYDVVLLEVEPSDGTVNWSRLWGGASDDIGHGIATDGTDLYVVGETSSVGAGGSDLVLLRWTLCCEELAAAPSVDDASVCLGGAQHFTGAGTGEGTLAYAWDFHYDGVTFEVESTEQNPSFTYPEAGAYTAALRVTDACTYPSPQSRVTTLPVSVTVNPVPAISGPTSVCQGASVALDAGAGYATYLWSPGGETTQTISPAPSTTTVYTVAVTTGGGCPGTSPGHTVTVYPPAPTTAPALSAPAQACAGQPFGLSWGAVSDATAYEVDEGCDGSVEQETALRALALSRVAGSFCFRVRGKNSCGTGPWSSGATVTVTAPGIAYTLGATIPVGTNPIRTVMTPNGQEVYVLNQSSNNVSVIATATDTVTNTVSVGTAPTNLAVHPDGSKVYIGCQGGGVYVIDTATKGVTSFSVGSPVNDLALSDSGDRLYLAMEWSALKKVVTATGAVSTISGTTCPEGVVFVPGTNKAYVNYQCAPPPGSGGNDPVYEFNATTDAYVTGFTVGAPHVGSNAMSASPDGSKIWVCGSGTIKVVRTSDNVKLTTLSGGYPTVAPDSARAYVPDGTNLKVYDTASFALLDTLALASSGSLAFNAAGTRFYTPVPGSNAVRVVNVSSAGACGTLPGAVPDGLDTPGAPLLATRGMGEAVALSWGAACGATDYALYSGTLESLSQGYGHTRVACTDTGGDRSETFDAPGAALYFLVVGHNGASEGSYGRDSAGAERPPGGSQCHPLAGGSCP